MGPTYEYAGLLRDIFCFIDEGFNHQGKSQKEEAKHFGIDPRDSPRTYLSCIYLLEDTSMALDNYNKFGLDGPTKYKEKDEAYLRLYGVLNAAYMQFLCCRELYKMYKIKDFKEFNDIAKTYKIIKVRHIAASHSVNYSTDEGIRDYYLISQMTLTGHGERLNVIGGKDGEYEYNIKEELKNFTTFIHKELSKICRQIIDKRFDENSKIYNEFIEKLETLDLKARGAILMEGPDGSLIVFSTREEE